MIHYVLPKLLLVATAWDEALAGEDLETSPSADAETFGSSSEIPMGTIAGVTIIPMVDPHETTDQLRTLFDTIQEHHDHPGIASYYRALGRWPPFLAAVWERIEPCVGSAPYQQRKRDLIDLASTLIRKLPVMKPIMGANLGVSGKQLTEVQSILAVFRFRLIPDLLLDVTLIEAMLNGERAARSSRFSVAGDTP